MKPAENLKVDIAHSGFVSPVEAVQGDGGLRSISVELTDSGKPWYPPRKLSSFCLRYASTMGAPLLSIPAPVSPLSGAEETENPDNWKPQFRVRGNRRIYPL